MKKNIFRVDNSNQGFNSSMFCAALKYLASDPCYEDVSEIVKTPDNIFQLRLSYGKESIKLMEELKQFYEIPHDTELVRLVLHVAKNNPLFWKHTPENETTAGSN